MSIVLGQTGINTKLTTKPKWRGDRYSMRSDSSAFERRQYRWHAVYLFIGLSDKDNASLITVFKRNCKWARIKGSFVRVKYLYSSKDTVQVKMEKSPAANWPTRLRLSLGCSCVLTCFPTGELSIKPCCYCTCQILLCLERKLSWNASTVAAATNDVHTMHQWCVHVHFRK